MRALIVTLENKCDVINMSYGEPTSRANVGKFCELATELVNKHGVIFVCSAGNSGPALSTAGAPGTNTQPSLCQLLCLCFTEFGSVGLCGFD